MASSSNLTANSNNFSNLLRRSKISNFNSNLEQIFTTNQSNLNRNNFGLKRNLPSKSNNNNNNNDPNYIRLLSLDSKERRTNFRNSSKEFYFFKKFQELNSVKLNIKSSNSGLGLGLGLGGSFGGGGGGRGDSYGYDNQIYTNKIELERLNFINSSSKDGNTLIPLEQSQSSQSQSLSQLNKDNIITLNLVKQSSPFLPNYLELTESDFNKFLSKLSLKRKEFKSFLVEDLKRIKFNQSKQDYLSSSSTSSTSSSLELEEPQVDLYKYAQTNPTELNRTIEKFLLSLSLSSPSTLSPSSSTTTSTSLLNNRRLLPLPHPTLGLQYSPPTSLESIRSPSIPGRILGPAPSSRGGGGGQQQSSRTNSVYALLLSTVSPVASSDSGGSIGTTFFPDGEGIRENRNGREMFKIDPHFLSSSTASGSRFKSLQSSRGGKKLMISGVLGGGLGKKNLGGFGVDVIGTKGQISETLHLFPIDLKAKVVTEGREIDLPGSMGYSGNLPPSSSLNSNSRGSTLDLGSLLGEGKGDEYLSLTKGNNLLMNKNASQLGGMQRELNTKRLREERRATDPRNFGNRGKGSKKEAKEGNKSSKSLLSSLQDLLDD